jgi:hypothetical protein
MRLRPWLMAVPVLVAAGVGLFADHLIGANAKQDGDPKPAVRLPLTQVVMFNSGVGYYARSGEVDGDARVDLTFPETDINDLIKSMTLQDFSGGTITAVSYDSREPVSRTLASFAINLNEQPSLANILTQARGEKVELTMLPGNAAQPGTLTGTVIGVEVQKVAVGPTTLDANMLTIFTAEGMRCVKMSDVQRVRFTNPVLENELKRALDVLATSHDTQKKAVSMHFSGDGKRKVKVGYVIEAPIWKTSYRLVLDKDAKPYLQGWAVIENTTDEDWGGVKMALVSGRPISFKMDLYNPRFLDRPTVEPELFRSLRPVAYEGGYLQNGGVGNPTGMGRSMSRGPLPTPMYKRGTDGRNELEKSAIEVPRDQLDQKLSAGFEPQATGKNRELARAMAERMDLAASPSAATASKLGDFFQYVIDQPVSLARQKSALLPIVGKDIEGTRVSIYNQAVQAKHPLLGLRFKNTTGANLAQGPVTVYEGSTYAGDARFLDISPNDERMIAFAIDLGCEVIPQTGDGKTTITQVKAQKGIVHVTRKQRDERTYKISNKSDTARTMVIEHPNRTNQQFKLVATAKPIEETEALWRFETKVEAGKSAEFKVTEERDLNEEITLTNSSEDQIRFFINLNEAGPELKAKLTDALKLKAKWDNLTRELQQVRADTQRIAADQDRVRKNLRETPKEADVYGEYLKKLSAQETELDVLTAKEKQLMAAEFAAKKGYEDFLSNIDG